MEALKFSTNWNNKLDCFSFSTIRLYDNEKYQIGKVFQPVLTNKKNEILKTWDPATIVYIHAIPLLQISEAMARLDTGYSREACIKIIQTMYPGKNWESQKIMFIVLTKKP